MLDHCGDVSGIVMAFFPSGLGSYLKKDFGFFLFKIPVYLFSQGIKLFLNNG